jgi:hypothetical protein
VIPPTAARAGRLLTDDRSDIELLTDLSLLGMIDLP